MNPKLRRVLYFLVGAVFLLGVLMPFELRFLRVGDLSETLLYLLFFNLNLVALGTLVYFVSKGFIELYLGVKRKTIGFKFRAKLLLFFTFLTLVPTVLVYMVASGLASNYMDKIFNAQFKDPLKISMKMARAVYQEEKSKAVDVAQEALEKDGVADLGPYKVYVIRKLPPDATPAMKAAFAGRKAAEVLSTPEGDLVRGMVPYPKGGVLSASITLPGKLTSYIEDIKRANEEAMKMDEWRDPIRTNFYLVLGFIALTIMFTALFAALRLAKGITQPVTGLARATKEVARGNLDLKVPPAGSDEMGLLVDSFNSMVAELKDGRQSLERAYMESDRRRLCMEGILDNIHTGVISLSPEGHVLTINPEACRILGINPARVIGSYYDKVLEGIQSDELKALIKGINVKTIQFVEQELWVGFFDGRRALLRVFISALRDAKGRHMGLLVVFDDLTELVRAQRALAWQEVARRIAHEIKNPLTPIKLSTERLMKKWAEGHEDFAQVFERSTKTIIKEVESLKRLVDEFSRFGKMPEIRKKPTNLMPLMEEIRNLYKAYKDFHLITDMPADMPLVDIDPEPFKRALMNLIDNAYEAMGAGEAGNAGRVSVKIKPDAEANRFFVEIADTGPGIGEDLREKLFQPYFSTKKHGTGLGLAIVHKIISEHNGYIRIGDNQPRGSVFTIEMPMREQ
ncbi:MAG: ATP-binding protein [Nitrospiraceae bacterium]|nr:ATP-binding protein [Nitrospiraceae bacterium]